MHLTWQAGQSSALDTVQIAKGRDVGSIRVRDAAGRDLPNDVMFVFAFHAFWPDGEWMLGRLEHTPNAMIRRRLRSELNQRMAFFAGAQFDRGLERVCINHLACITERHVIHARPVFRN